jgi:hypothetical protein
MKNFLAGGDESVVAVPAKSTSIDVFIGVLAIVGFVGSTVNIITISAHSFSVMLLVRMRTVGDLVHLFGFEDAVQRCRIKLIHGLVNHFMGLSQSLPISIDLDSRFLYATILIFSQSSLFIILIFLTSLLEKLQR